MKKIKFVRLIFLTIISLVSFQNGIACSGYKITIGNKTIFGSTMAIYKAYLRDTISPGQSWENQMLDDLNYFKEHHYDVTIFDKVFSDLKIKKP